MISRSMLLGVAVALVVALGLAGCGKSKSADSGKSGETAGTAGGGQGTAQVSGLDREAQDAALAEIHKHWVKGPDGWTSALISGSPYAPDHILRQFRELTVDSVQSNDLSESDRMNGFEWAGQVQIKQSPCREAGDPGIAFEGMSNPMVNRQRGRWTQWVDFTPLPLHVQKVKGQWQVNTDNTLVSGAIPGPHDFANAGVR